MKWRLIDKANSKPPTSGTYRQWKPQLSQEAGRQCVYCCIPESKFGGLRNFHVEHYRPKSLFPHLENEYNNLFFACGICNIFKSDDWPAEPQVGTYSSAGYPDPSVEDYCNFLELDEFSGEVRSNVFTGKYIIERLHLNRPQMVGLRSVNSLLKKLDAAAEEISNLIEMHEIPNEDKDEIIALLNSFYKLSRKFSEARPYSEDQLR